MVGEDGVVPGRWFLLHHVSKDGDDDGDGDGVENENGSFVMMVWFQGAGSVSTTFPKQRHRRRLYRSLPWPARVTLTPG